MITQVHKRGSRVGGLLRYLFGPGRFEEHVNPRLVGAWDGAGDLTDLEPVPTVTGGRDLRHLVGLLGQPVRAADHAPTKYVWHASMRLAPVDRSRTISDATWGHMARELLAEAGIARHGDLAGLRWVVVRHNDDHVHIVATLVREDGRIDWLKNDWPRCKNASARIAHRFGLHVAVPPADRTTARRPGPSEVHRARRLGRPRTDRDELRHRVRAAVAAATTEDELFAALRADGVLVTLRESTQHPGQVTGYAVALPPHGVHAPIFYSGGKLAPDLTLPKLRQRFSDFNLPPVDRQRAGVGPDERVRVLRQAAAATRAAAARLRHTAGSDPAGAQATAEAAADTLRATALVVEGRRGGPVTDAAEVFDRAARAGTGPHANPTARSYRLRAMSRLVSLMGRVSGDDQTRAVLRLLLQLASLGDTLARVRTAQQRQHQAQAAQEAATKLRAVVTTTGPTATLPAIPTPTTGHTVRHGRTTGTRAATHPVRGGRR